MLVTAVAERVATQDADRAAIRQALAQPQVRHLAARMAVDLTRAEAAVDTMTGHDLGALAFSVGWQN